MDEISKAAEEIAKTTGKAIDAASRAGGFLAEFIKEPLRERFGIITDNLKYRRWENMLNLQQRAIRKLEALGVESTLRPIPAAVAVPLLEAASLVEDDDLSERWANLLVNFAAQESGVSVQRSFITVLQELNSLDAIILEKIYSLPERVRDPEAGRSGILTGRLPEIAEHSPPQSEVSNPVVTNDPKHPSGEVELSLSNLIRLGCLTSATAWDGGQLLFEVYPTPFGRALIKACSTPKQNSSS